MDAARAAGETLARFLADALKEQGGRVRAEDFISAAAAIAGERCIDAAGQLPVRTHTLTPGSAVLSDDVNRLLCNDVPETAALPSSSAIGLLRDELLQGRYSLDEFPHLDEVIRGFVAGIGTAEWGWVPLSVPDHNRPSLMPLRAAYETRNRVDAILAPAGDPAALLRAAILALAIVLNMVAGVIDHRIALALALETLNGMAKTVPMTDRAFREAAEQAAPNAPPPHKPWWRFW